MPENQPILVTVRTAVLVGKKWVPFGYGYMAARATIFDGQLIRWAEDRERWLKERKTKS